MVQEVPERIEEAIGKLRSGEASFPRARGVRIVAKRFAKLGFGVIFSFLAPIMAFSDSARLRIFPVPFAYLPVLSVGTHLLLIPVRLLFALFRFSIPPGFSSPGCLVGMLKTDLFAALNVYLFGAEFPQSMVAWPDESRFLQALAPAAMGDPGAQSCGGILRSWGKFLGWKPGDRIVVIAEVGWSLVREDLCRLDLSVRTGQLLRSDEGKLEGVAWRRTETRTHLWAGRRGRRWWLLSATPV